jgi:hypothetical protein
MFGEGQREVETSLGRCYHQELALADRGSIWQLLSLERVEVEQ